MRSFTAFVIFDNATPNPSPISRIWLIVGTFNASRDKYLVHLVWRASVRPGVVVRRSLGASCLGGFGSSPRSSSAARSRPAVRYFLHLSSVEPVPLRHAPRLPLLQSILQWRFRSPAEAAILSLSLSFVSRRRGSALVQSQSVSSVCLSDRYFPSRDPPSPVPVTGPFWPACIMKP